MLLTLPALLAHIKMVHGTVTAIDLSAMKAALLQKFASPADFRNHATLFADRVAAIHLEEAIAPTALFAIFKETFAHHPSFLPSMGRLFEMTPLRANHTVPNLIAHLIPRFHHRALFTLCCLWVARLARTPKSGSRCFPCPPFQVDPSREDKEREAGETARCPADLYG